MMIRVLLLLLLTGTAWGQAKFEAVAIRPCRDTPYDGAKFVEEAPGHLRFICVTVDQMVRYAHLWHGSTYWKTDPKTGEPGFKISNRQRSQTIKGSPGWLNSQRYNIDARAAVPANPDLMYGQMLPALLRDRFHLKIHTEPREVSVYFLTVAKGGSHLKPFKAGSCFQVTNDSHPAPRTAGSAAPLPICGLSGSPKGMDLRGLSFAGLSDQLSLFSEKDVVDRTGIEGRFEGHIDVPFTDLMRARPAAQEAGTASDPGGTLQDAVRAMGLKLENGKATYDFLVIDHVEKPSAN